MVSQDAYREALSDLSPPRTVVHGIQGFYGPARKAYLRLPKDTEEHWFLMHPHSCYLMSRSEMSEWCLATDEAGLDYWCQW